MDRQLPGLNGACGLKYSSNQADVQQVDHDDILSPFSTVFNVNESVQKFSLYSSEDSGGTDGEPQRCSSQTAVPSQGRGRSDPESQ